MTDMQNSRGHTSLLYSEDRRSRACTCTSCPKGRPRLESNTIVPVLQLRVGYTERSRRNDMADGCEGSTLLLADMTDTIPYTTCRRLRSHQKKACSSLVRSSIRRDLVRRSVCGRQIMQSEYPRPMMVEATSIIVRCSGYYPGGRKPEDT